MSPAQPFLQNGISSGHAANLPATITDLTEVVDAKFVIALAKKSEDWGVNELGSALMCE